MEPNHHHEPAPTTMNDTLSAAGLLVKDNQATDEMKRSISNFAALLICPLCSKIFDQPATLSACAHTFCMDCIDAYAAKHSVCPVGGCGMPMSIVGSHGGSFRKRNVQISQTIESLQLICASLDRSEELCWRSPSTLQSVRAMRSSSSSSSNNNNNSTTANDDDDESQVLLEEDEEMIDLQQQANDDDEDEHSRGQMIDDDDDHATDGTIDDDETL